MDGLSLLGKHLLTAIRDCVPIAVTIVAFQLAVIRRPLPHLRRIVLGFGLVVFGIAVFLQGLDLALFPLGEAMAVQLTGPQFVHSGASAADYLWVYAFTVSLGLTVTLAEPALIAVALKAQEISAGAINPWGLRLAVAIGVAVGITLGAYRIISGGSLVTYILTCYALVLTQTLCAPRMIVGLAYDCGGVTTSTVTVPLVTALGLGLAKAVPGRSVLVDGFGLIAFTCLFPIMSVLGYAQLSAWFARMRR